MALSLHINNTKKAPYFDGTNYAYWKVKMTAHLKGPNMARGGVNSLFKNSTNSLEQEVSK